MSRRRKRRAQARPVDAPVTAAVSEEAAVTPVARTPLPEVLVREPQTIHDLQEIHMLLLMQGREMAPVPPNPAKVMARIEDAVKDRANYVMLMAVVEGRLVGILLLVQAAPYYSDEMCLFDWGFFVLPSHRNGEVGRTLLDHAEALAEAAGIPCFINRLNPTRHRGRIAETIGFIPMGATLRLDRRGPASRPN